VVTYVEDLSLTPEDSFPTLDGSFSTLEVLCRFSSPYKLQVTILVLRKTKIHFTPGSFSYASSRGPMTDPPLSTMASSVDADSSRASSQARTSTADLPAQQATKKFVT